MALADILARAGGGPTLYDQYQQRERQFGLDQLAKQETQQAMELRDLKMKEAKQAMDIAKQKQDLQRQAQQDIGTSMQLYQDALATGDPQRINRAREIAFANTARYASPSVALQYLGQAEEKLKTSTGYNDWLAQGGQQGTGMSYMEYAKSMEGGGSSDLAMPPSVSGASVEAGISNWATENVEEEAIPKYKNAVRDLAEGLLSSLRRQGHPKALSPKEATDWAEEQAKDFVGVGTGLMGGLLPDIGAGGFNSELYEQEREKRIAETVTEMTAPRVETVEEAMKLPPGTVFIDPDGQRRVR